MTLAPTLWSGSVPTIAFQVFESIDLTWGEFVPAVNASSQLSSFPTDANGAKLVTNKNILIYGVFVIDVNTRFLNCRLIMTENSKIVVKSDRQLNVVKSRLFGLDRMWLRIHTERRSTLRMTDSRIEDAVHGIKTIVGGQSTNPYKKTKISLQRDTFNCNHIGISNKFGPDLEVLIFRSNLFSCSDPLIPLPQVWDNAGTISFLMYSNIRGLAAIDLDNSNAIFNSVETGRNFFKNYRYGFSIVNSSNVSINYCNFSCIESVANAPNGAYGIGGTAIYSTYVGAVNVQKCSFNYIEKNCIHNDATNIVAINNIFGDIDPISCLLSKSGFNTGVRSESLFPGYLGTYNISNNTFLFGNSNAEWGIKMQRPLLNTQITIDNAIISSNTFSRVIPGSQQINSSVTPIYVDLVTNHLNGGLQISKNEFDINGTVTLAAICLEGSSTLQQAQIYVSENNIKLNTNATSTQTRTGAIRINNVKNIRNNNLVNNNIITNSGTSNLRSAIWGFQTSGFCFKQNTMDKSQFGIKMYGNNNLSSFSENVIKQHQYGMYFDDIPNQAPVSIGAQYRKGNIWTGPFSALGAWIEPTTPSLGLNKFSIHSSLPQFNPTNNVVDWFSQDIGALVPECFKSPLAPISNPDLAIISNNFGAIVNPHQPWFKSLDLLFRIHTLPTAQPLAYTNYAASMAGTSQNEFAKYMAQTVNLLQADTSQSQQMLTAQNAVDTLRSQINTQLLLLSSDGDLPQDVQILAQIDLLQSNLDAQSMKIVEAQIAQKAKHDAAVTTLNGIHGALPAGNLVEAIVKRILFFDIQREQGFSPYTQNIQSELYGIATSDPNTVGEAALWAAQRLSGCFKDNYEVFFEAQQNANQVQLLQSATEKKTQLSVYPNPTRDRFSCHVAGSSILKVQLFSSTGAVVATQSYAVETDLVEFETLLLPEGLYRVVATTNIGRIYSSNVAVLR